MERAAEYDEGPIARSCGTGKEVDTQVPVYPLVHEIRIDIVAHIGELFSHRCAADRRHAVDVRSTGGAGLDVHDHPSSDGQVHRAAEPQCR